MTTASIVVAGDVRTDYADPAYDLATLINIARDPSLPSPRNPSKSHGASVIIRELLLQTGLPHTIQGELYNDAQQFGHLGGNAVDIGPSSQIETFLSSIAPLFSCVSSPTLFIWDGLVGPSGIVGAAGVQFAAQCSGHLHIASSPQRMLRVLLTNTSVRNVLQSPFGVVGLTNIITNLGTVLDPPFSTQRGSAEVDSTRLGDW